MNDLPPEVQVFKGDRQFRRINPVSDWVVYQDETIRVMRIICELM